MRAVRVECATSSISHDFRVQKALEFVSWDYRGNLGIIDGNLRLMIECITTDSQCLPPGFSIGGISVVEVLEEWTSDYLTHHLLVLEFNSEIIILDIKYPEIAKKRSTPKYPALKRFKSEW